ncbi:MAG: hypothetical protein A2X52_05550 [Candidatus Rokubacteria bacterium GWC2_70_16]|nr:MAG: hypothetical protein A2X52_05550 [Candidatus Rokubacteria bacterium GWC2_70_16]
MRFLADESCDHAVVRALRAAGFDVVAVAEVTPRASDEAVIERAAREGRVLLTEDKDFGQLVYASARSTAGVILLRFPAGARASLADGVLRLVRRQGDSLVGGFAVVQPGRVRIARGPGA